MARTFLPSLYFWIALIPIVVTVLVAMLAHHTRLRNPATIDVCHFLRGADVKRMLVQFVLDDLRGIPEPEFMERHRLMLHESREFMRAVIHDMGVLIVWCNAAFYRELVERPWEADGEETGDDSAEFVEAHERLAAAAREFRRFAFFSLVRINLAILFGTHWQLRWLAPFFMVHQWTNRLLKVYGKVFKEVVETGTLYDDDLPQSFLIALFKIENPAADIALWRMRGFIPH